MLFSRAGVLDYPIALHMTEYIRNERNYVPWAVMLRSLFYIDTMLRLRRSYKFYQVRNFRISITEP